MQHISLHVAASFVFSAGVVFYLYVLLILSHFLRVFVKDSVPGFFSNLQHLYGSVKGGVMAGIGIETILGKENRVF